MKGMSTAPAEVERPESDVESEVRPDTPWVTVVWDDPVNLMEYVTYVFQKLFGYPKKKAERLMMQVHTEGKAAVASGNREEMERHVEAMHGYGLQATLEQVEQ